MMATKLPLLDFEGNVFEHLGALALRSKPFGDVLNFEQES